MVGKLNLNFYYVTRGSFASHGTHSESLHISSIATQKICIYVVISSVRVCLFLPCKVKSYSAYLTEASRCSAPFRQEGLYSERRFLETIYILISFGRLSLSVL